MDNPLCVCLLDHRYYLLLINADAVLDRARAICLKTNREEEAVGDCSGMDLDGGLRVLVNC